jgi:phosphoketolase
MHQAMASTLEQCVKDIREVQKQSRESGKAFRPRWPMIILRTPVNAHINNGNETLTDFIPQTERLDRS